MILNECSYKLLPDHLEQVQYRHVLQQSLPHIHAYGPSISNLWTNADDM